MTEEEADVFWADSVGLTEKISDWQGGGGGGGGLGGGEERRMMSNAGSEFQTKGEPGI